MAGKRHTAEQIVRKLREAGIELANGQSIKAVCKRLEITDQTYFFPSCVSRTLRS